MKDGRTNILNERGVDFKEMRKIDRRYASMICNHIEEINRTMLK